MVDYPASFPLDEIKSVIDVVRNGSVKENVKSFAHDLWVVQGYAQSTIIGDDTPDFSLSIQADVDVVSELEKLVVNAESDAPSAQIAVPWELILQWLLKELMNALASNS